MSFRAEITEEYTKIEGKTDEILAGLVCYIKTLKKEGISQKVLQQVVELGLEDEEKKRAETILDTEVKIQKIDLNNMSKEEAKDLITKEILKMFD